MDILILVGIVAVAVGAVWATRRNEGKNKSFPSQPGDFTDSEGSVAPAPKPKPAPKAKPKAKAAPKRKPAGGSRTKAPTQKK